MDYTILEYMSDEEILKLMLNIPHYKVKNRVENCYVYTCNHILLEKILNQREHLIVEIDRRDYLPLNILMVASNVGCNVCVSKILNYETAKKNILMKNRRGETALHYAFKGGHVLCAKLLLSHSGGYGYDIKNNDGQTPLDICRSKNIKFFKEILNECSALDIKEPCED